MPSPVKRRSRVKEPSTYAGLAAALAGLAPMLPVSWQSWAAVIAAMLGSVAVALRERAHNETE